MASVELTRIFIKGKILKDDLTSQFFIFERHIRSPHRSKLINQAPHTLINITNFTNILNDHVPPKVTLTTKILTVIRNILNPIKTPTSSELIDLIFSKVQQWFISRIVRK